MTELIKAIDKLSLEDMSLVVPNPNANVLLLNFPNEIFMQIVKELPIFDIFSLRRSCWSLYWLLGPENKALWYFHLCGGKIRKIKRRRFNKKENYLGIVQEILSGNRRACQWCLRPIKTGDVALDSYIGTIFYKTLCQGCTRDNFCGLQWIQESYAGLKISPSDIATFPTVPNSPWTGRLHRRNKRLLSYCMRNKDLKRNLEEQIKPLLTPSFSLARLVWSKRFDNSIECYEKNKIGEDEVIRAMTCQYTENHEDLHWLLSPENFTGYLYRLKLWGLQPWLSFFRDDHSLPPVDFDSTLKSLLRVYLEGEDLPPVLRERNLEIGCRDALMCNLMEKPTPGKAVRKPLKTSPMIRQWLEGWLSDRGYKGVPSGKSKNDPRGCPFCSILETKPKSCRTNEKGVRILTCTPFLAIHIWKHHFDKMYEDWPWIDV